MPFEHDKPAPAPAELPLPAGEESIARETIADHARYFNATRDARYKYLPTRAVRAGDVVGAKGEVYLDGFKLGHFLRLEYGGARLNANARRLNRILGKSVIGEIRLWSRSSPRPVTARSPFYYCKWTRAYQLEVWEALETPPGTHHSFRVLDFMGSGGSITKIAAFNSILADLRDAWSLSLEMREGGSYEPYGYAIRDDFAAWDSLEVAGPPDDGPRQSAGPVRQAVRVPHTSLHLVL